MGVDVQDVDERRVLVVYRVDAQLRQANQRAGATKAAFEIHGEA